MIQDNGGNQFVWIPVGEIKNKDGSTTTITLGRYTFGSDGTPELKQNADNYMQTVTIESYYQELTSNSGNIAAKSLSTFVTRTQTNGGYYFGRYEASKGVDNKVKSQYDKTTWANITQSNAATNARSMYSSYDVDSDLINSYSWDTAIVFIQKYSRNTNYANKTPEHSNELNTGMSGDKVCNIYDMASNHNEWSTEHYANSLSPCGFRGGNYRYKLSTVSGRGNYKTTDSYPDVSFRPLLYLK